MNNFTDERLAAARARCEAATFGGDASIPFWQAVWGFYDTLDGQNPMPEQERHDILYDYGCKAQEMEAENARLRGLITDLERGCQCERDYRCHNCQKIINAKAALAPKRETDEPQF